MHGKAVGTQASPMSDYANEARKMIRTLGREGAGELLRLLDQPDAVRADAFRQLHERGTNRALEDALLDIEADPVMRGWLTEHLRLELHQL